MSETTAAAPRQHEEPTGRRVGAEERNPAVSVHSDPDGRVLVHHPNLTGGKPRKVTPAKAELLALSGWVQGAPPEPERPDATPPPGGAPAIEQKAGRKGSTTSEEND